MSRDPQFSRDLFVALTESQQLENPGFASGQVGWTAITITGRVENCWCELNELVFVVLGGRSDSRSLVEAIVLGKDTAARLAAIGDTEGAAELMRQVALGPVLDLGRYHDLVTFDKLASDMAGETLPSERSLVFRALATALAGQLSEHQQAVNTLEALYGHLSTGWLESYLWGARMVAASVALDVDGVGHSYDRYRQSIGELADTPAGLIWESLAAGAFAVVGDADRALEALARAKAFQSRDPAAVGMAELIVSAKVGDAGAAVAIRQRLQEADLLPLERRWRADLELIFAAKRQDRAADEELESTLELATRVGLGGLAQILARPLSDAGTSISIQLFGEFTVRLSSGNAEFATGKPTELIKILALKESPLPVESVVDALWPEADPKSGRSRIKNVVNRARQITGHDAIVRRADMLSLRNGLTRNAGGLSQRRFAYCMDCRVVRRLTSNSTGCWMLPTTSRSPTRRSINRFRRPQWTQIFRRSPIGRFERLRVSWSEWVWAPVQHPLGEG